MKKLHKCLLKTINGKEKDGKRIDDFTVPSVVQCYEELSELVCTSDESTHFKLV